MVEDTEGSSQSWTQIPGCCADCHDYDDLQNDLDCDCNVHERGFILLNASRNGHMDCVKACQAEGANVNIKDINGRAALIFAVRNGSVQCTDLLLQTGADVNIKDWLGRTALFDAVTKGSVQCTDLLLKAGADGNIQYEDGRTVLFHAVWNRSVECIDLLLKAGAGVNITDNWGETALFDAVRRRSVQCIGMLLKAGTDVNIRDKEGKTALFFAFVAWDERVQDRWGRTVIKYATVYNSVQCTDLLLKAGANVNIRDKKGETVLFLDTFYPRISTTAVWNSIKVMLREGIKVNVRDNYGSNALTYFLYYTRKSVGPHCSAFAMLLLSAAETVDKDGRIKLLHLLNESDDIVPVEVLDYLKSPAEISLMNICRETIRKHLLQMSDMNLFVRVPRLPLPRLMTSYLLYDVKLDD